MTLSGHDRPSPALQIHLQPLLRNEIAILLFLLFNVVFASAFTLIIKLVQVRKREDVITVGAINYIVAAVWIAPEFLYQSN